MANKYYDNLYLIRILSEEELPDCRGPGDMLGLLQETIDGGTVGDLVMASSTEVSPQLMASLLYAAGSEPSFFTDLAEEVGDGK